MIIDSITLRNFGVYQGTQTLVLTPPNKEQPIVLFGGMNGGGKTTLLDAIQLTLYGPRARCAGRGKLGYREYLQSMIHRGADPAQGAAVEMQFQRFLNGELHNYRVVRSWHENSKGLAESVQVYQGGSLDPLLSEQWDEYIESFIPCGIAHLFFFDAEQIEELAEGEHAAEILGTAIHTLLGLSIVEQLEDDLLSLERRKRLELRSRAEVETIKHLQEECDRLQSLLDVTVRERAQRGDALGRLQKHCEEFQQVFHRDGGALYQTRGALESERVRLDGELRSIEAKLRAYAGGVAPLLLIPDLLETTERQILAEAKMQKQKVLLEALAERDKEILKRLKKQEKPRFPITSFEKLLVDDRKERERTMSSDRPVLQAEESVAVDLRHLRQQLLPHINTEIEQQLTIASDLQEKTARLDQKLTAIPAEEVGAVLVQKHEEIRRNLREKEAECAVHDEKVKVLVRQLEVARTTLRRALDSDVDTQMTSEEGARILRHSAAVRKTLEEFRQAIIRRRAEQLERLVLESFQYLLRKRHLVTKIRINPEDFSIELTGGDDRPLPARRLSQGERQLLATSLLWGLAKASGRPLPTIIDTPLARLDSSHRRHMLDRYFPVASHQVILLSTDEEVDEESWRRLKPYIGRNYYLKFDDVSRSTTATEGYFWHYETTR